MAADTETLHATCVARDGRAVLIRGTSGSGKSALGLQLMALGAGLVADDRVVIRADGGALMAAAPTPIRGMIEARGVGLLAAGTVDAARVVLVVDLDRTEADRLPPRRVVRLLGREVELLHKCEGAHFAAAIWQYLKAGRAA